MYRKCFVVLLLNILFANHLVAQVSTNKIKLKNRLFFYSGASAQYYPRLKPIKVDDPGLFVTTPILGYGFDVFGLSYEFLNGKLVFGCQAGMDTQEFFGDVGYFDPYNEGFSWLRYRLGAFGDGMRGVVNSDISWRFNLNRKSTLNLGLFGGVDGFRNGGGSYRQGYSSSQDPLHYYIEAIYDDEDENEYTWGFQFGFSRNNWDMVLRHEFIKSEIQYRTYTIPVRISNPWNDLYEKRQYYFSLNVRYYFKRKRNSLLFQDQVLSH
jgi:hypothetical protein